MGEWIKKHDICHVLYISCYIYLYKYIFVYEYILYIIFYTYKTHNGIYYSAIKDEIC